MKAEGGTSDDSELEKKARDKAENISIRNMAGAILSIKIIFERKQK